MARNGDDHQPRKLHGNKPLPWHIQCYIYIKQHLNGIQKVTNEGLFGRSKGVSPEFNGIVLQKLLPDTSYEFKTVLSTWYSEQPYGNDVLDMRYSLKESDEPTVPNILNPLNILMGHNPSDIKPMRSPITCKQTSEDLNKLIKNLSQQYDECQKLDSDQKQLEQKIQALEQMNQRLKTFQQYEEVKDNDTTNNKDSMYLYFLIIIDLFMLFYILYKHKDYFVGMK